MGTSNTYSYNITASGLITDALRTLSVLEEGGEASATQITDSLPAFEMYLKSMSKYGLNLWTINNISETITLIAGQDLYGVPASSGKGLKMVEAVYRSSDGSDVPLRALSREEYWNLGDKTTTGEPTQYFYDPSSFDLSSISLLYIWPVPDANAATGTIQAVYQKYIQDIADSANTINVPQEWLETIKYGLAVRLAPMYGYPVQERNLLLREYQQMLKESLDWDTEQESIYLQPDYNGH